MQARITTYELTILYVIPSRNKDKICSMRAKINRNHKINYSFDVYDALELFKTYYKSINPFDLVFIEYYLDVAEGICLIEEIKKIDPNSLFIMYIKSAADLEQFRNNYPEAKYLAADSNKEGVGYNRVLGIAVEIKLDELVNGDKKRFKHWSLT